MRIVVLVKHTPDPQGERRFEAGRLVRGQDDGLNEMDEHAIEAALQLREQVGGEVVALSLGPGQARSSLLRALQMGADYGVLVSDERLGGADAPTTARALAGAIERIGLLGVAGAGGDGAPGATDEQAEEVRAVFAGVASSDGMTSLVPGALASCLGFALIGGVSGLEASAQEVRGTVALPGGSVELHSAWPAVISVSDELNRPRHPGFKDMLAAKKKTVWEWDLSQLSPAASADLAQRLTSASGAAWRVDSCAPEGPREAGTIISDTGEAGAKLAAYLQGEGFGA